MPADALRSSKRFRGEEADHRHRRLLRPRRERPCCRRPAEQRDELAPLPPKWERTRRPSSDSKAKQHSADRAILLRDDDRAFLSGVAANVGQSIAAIRLSVVVLPVVFSVHMVFLRSRGLFTSRAAPPRRATVAKPPRTDPWRLRASVRAVGSQINGLAEDAEDRPEPAHVLRAAALFVDSPIAHSPL